MSITFGSVGDIIAVAELAFKIVKALSESRGASKEYQDLMLELDLFRRALQEADRFLKPNRPVRLQPHTENAVRHHVTLCKKEMEEFMKKIKKYQESLRKGGSGNMMRDSWRKVGWSLFKKEDLATLRGNLSMHRGTIMWILVMAGW